MPKNAQDNFTLQSVAKHLANLEGHGKSLAKWRTTDLAEAKKAKASLVTFLSLSAQLSSFLANTLHQTPKEKKANSLTTYREKLKEIKQKYFSSGLEASIDNHIQQLERNEAKTVKDKQKVAEQNRLAHIEVKRLMSQITSTVDAYAKASFEDKDALLAQFKQTRELLNEQVDLLTDRASYAGQVSDLSRTVNERTRVLEKEEIQLKQIVLNKAKSTEKAVDAMTVNEQILSIAPAQVQVAVKKLTDSLSASDLHELLVNDASKDGSLVHFVQGEIVAAAGSESEISKQLAVIAGLAPEQQLAVVYALISGKDSKGVLANLSQSTQMALSVSLINQLAVKAKLDQADQLAIREFSAGLIGNMARIERGEATHLSVLALVKDYSGKEIIAQFHVDLQSLRTNPVDLAALLALNLLKIGAKADTQVVTAFSTQPQVGALLQLRGRPVSSLAIENKSLQEIVTTVMKNTASIQQITNGEVDDVSDKALVSATKYSNAIVFSKISLPNKKGANDKSGAELVVDVIRALAIMNQTVQATVINTGSKKSLGINNLVGNAPRFLLEDGNPIAVAALEQKDSELFPLPAPNKPVPAVINEELVRSFSAALDKLRSLQESLVKKYGRSSENQYIIITNGRFITALESALTQYEANGNLLAFRRAAFGAAEVCELAKGQYNTHRDGLITRFFAAIVHAFKDLWITLYGNAESVQTRAGVSSFFNNTSRPTRSATALYKFNCDLVQAFSLVDLEEEEQEEEIANQASVSYN